MAKAKAKAVVVARPKSPPATASMDDLREYVKQTKAYLHSKCNAKKEGIKISNLRKEAKKNLEAADKGVCELSAKSKKATVKK